MAVPAVPCVVSGGSFRLMLAQLLSAGSADRTVIILLLLLAFVYSVWAAIDMVSRQDRICLSETLEEITRFMRLSFWEGA